MRCSSGPYDLSLPLPGSLTLACQLPKNLGLAYRGVSTIDNASVIEYPEHWPVVEGLSGLHGSELGWEKMENTKEKGRNNRLIGGGQILLPKAMHISYPL